MVKYNIEKGKKKKKKGKEAAYRAKISPQQMDDLEEKIKQLIVKQKKYLEKDYSAKKLAEEIGVKSRDISAVMIVRFQMNYNAYVNMLRIKKAKSILVDERYQDVRVTKIGEMVGFNNRQSFYGAFYRYVGITPLHYRMQQLAKTA